jgi:hypothetical protein
MQRPAPRPHVFVHPAGVTRYVQVASHMSGDRTVSTAGTGRSLHLLLMPESPEKL